MNRSLRIRLAQVEGKAPGEPRFVLADSPLSDEDIALKMRDWRDEVAAGRASCVGRAITFMSQAEPVGLGEWEACYCR